VKFNLRDVIKDQILKSLKKRKAEDEIEQFQKNKNLKNTMGWMGIGFQDFKPSGYSPNTDQKEAIPPTPGGKDDQ